MAGDVQAQDVPPLCLLSDSLYVWGVGTFDKERYDKAKHDVFRIKFVGHYHWEMWHLDKHLMTVKNGEPKLPLPRVDPVELGDNLRQRFPDITDAAVDRLIKIVKLASRQQHGTTIVISKSAHDESERLAGNKRLAGNNGVRPFTLDKSTIAGATSIDGAIMVDSEGTCHGVGLILDGLASEGESPARGSRYNSVVRYTCDRNDCLGVVFSVDGMIDTLPR